jgi:hypothetical protein
VRRVSHRLVYPATTVDRVYGMLGEPEFRRAVADYQGVVRCSVDVTAYAEGMTVRLEQAHGTSAIPSFARKFVGDELVFVQEETWSSVEAADVQVTIPGKPGEMTGGTRLQQTGADVVHVFELAVRVSVPLVGGKVEDLVAGFIGHAFAAENKVGRKWLTGQWRT